MPRSSKNKSSKHSSRDAREYSDPERDSGVKDRKIKDKNSATAAKMEKRRVVESNSKEGEYTDDYGGGVSSKRRRDGGGDRWNGGGDDNRGGEATKKDSKSSRRREEEGEEVKRSSGKHKDSSSRKESREGERKLKDGRSKESLIDVVDDEQQKQQRVNKQVFENNNDSRKIDELRSLELDNQLERRMRKRRDDYDDGGKLQDDAGDGYDRHKNDTAKDGKKKDDRRKDEKYRENYREEMERENKHRHDKQRDERPAKDHASIRSDDKHERGEKNILESRQKRTKLPDSERDRYRDRDGERDQDHDFENVRDREREYDFDMDREYERGRDWDLYHDRERDRHRDRDGSHVDDKSVRSKEGGTKKRTLDDRDDYSDSKSRVVKSHYPDAEKRSLSNSKADSDIGMGISQPRQVHADSTGTSNKHRNANAEDPKYKDSTIEQRTKGSREGYSRISERTPKYKIMENPTKMDEGPVGDLSTERSSVGKTNPMGLMERSPSSTSIERRYVNKSVVKRSVEIDEGGRRKSIDARDDYRLGRELALEKPLLDESSQADSSFYDRTNPNNASLVPPPPSFRAPLDKSYMGSLEDDVRDNSNNRYRRNGEPGFGRLHGGNSWRAVPNWTSPVPNGFVPFPPGPAHRGFQTMMPHFTSQPIFGIRPPMDHAGIPYHIADGDRFPGHLRPPLGWQNMMDGTGPAHLHGWDSNNGIFRDDPHMYGGSDWDMNKHSRNSHGWESDSETWKEQNSDTKKDLPSPACKDESVPALVDGGVTDQTTKVSLDEHKRDGFHEKSPEPKLGSLVSPAKVPLNSLSTIVPDTSIQSDRTFLSHFYLLKLDISEDLVLPELYDQCMFALNADKNASIGAEASSKPFLKQSARRAQQKYAATLSGQAPFPVIDNSVFKRAIDLYKKHRVKLSKEELDIIMPSNLMEVDELLPASSLENKQVSVSASDGTKDVLLPAVELKNIEDLSPAKDHLDEINQPFNQMEEDYDSTHSLKIDMAGQYSINENQEAVAALCENEDKVTSDKVKSSDAEENYSMASKNEATVKSSDEEENYSMASKNEAPLATTLQEEGDNMNSKAKATGDDTKVNNPLTLEDGSPKVTGDDTKVNPLILEDGSPKVCDALMPGSNESESLILSRIHHSPENTH
ncbi:unnamed protein product [Lupinus luteus]|uniref:Uncharacterized protein n=1 Tax=Lupinus luteus TaxID=3873 RepID=A0AAV1W8V0_LUPLU